MCSLALRGAEEKVQRERLTGLCPWTRLRREGSEGSKGSKGSEGKVLKEEKVLKIDRPFRAGGFLSLTALRAEGCGIALRAMLIKSALRDFLYVSYGMISILRIGSLRSPPPIRAAPDFPRKRGQNKANA